MNLTYLESFEQNLIEKYGVQIHKNVRSVLIDDRFWDVQDEFCVVRSGTAFEAFHYYIEKSRDKLSEKDALKNIIQRFGLVGILIEVTHLKTRDLNQYIVNNENRVRLVELDFVIMACTLAQVVKNGVISNYLMRLFMSSIFRQLNLTLNDLECNGNRKEIDRRCNLIEDLSQMIIKIAKSNRED